MNAALNGIATVVDNEDNGRQTVRNHGRQLLDRYLTIQHRHQQQKIGKSVVQLTDFPLQRRGPLYPFLCHELQAWPQVRFLTTQ
jgi:hypothetical protein